MEFEDIRKKFGELPSRGVGWASLFSLSIILFVIQAIEKLVKGSAFVGTIVLAGISVHAGKPEIAAWLLIGLSALCILPVLLTVIWAHSVAARQLIAKQASETQQHLSQQIRDVEASKNKAQHALVETMHAASVIRAQQTPAAAHTAKTLEEIHVVYRIHKDFSASFTKQYKVKAAAEALHFWETSISPSSHADPIDYLSDINFQLSDITDPQNRFPLTYLQTQNDLRDKAVCIYFLPRLLAADPPRTIEIAFRWPRYMAELQNTGRETLNQSFNSAAGTKRFITDVLFEDGNGGTCGLQVVSTHTHQLLPLREAEWSGFRYLAENLPPGNLKHELSATWKKS